MTHLKKSNRICFAKKKKKKFLNANSEFSQEKWQKKLRLSKSNLKSFPGVKAKRDL